MVDIQVRVLGRVEILGTSERLPTQLAKILAVLAASRHDKAVSSGVLVDALWPESAPRQLAVPMAKLRKALEPTGLTVSVGWGGRGYRLSPLRPGVDVTDVVDRYRFQAWADEAEHLIGHGQVAEALGRLRQAAAMWHGPPYSVGTGAEEDPPITCREARRALETQQENLAKNWVLAGLLSGEHDVLEWIQQDGQLSKRLGGNQQVWLLRLAELLVSGDHERAAQMVKQGHEDGYHHMTSRGHELLELSKYGVEFQLRSVPTPERTDHADHDDQADPDCATFADLITAVVAGPEHVMRMAMTAASTTLTTERMRSIAAAAGVRLLHGSCRADEPEVWRMILRELLVAAIRDPHTTWDKLRTAIEFADGTAALEPAIADSSASVFRAVATRGPVVVVLQDAHLLGERMARLLTLVADRIEGQRIGFILVDEDTEQSSASGQLPPFRSLPLVPHDVLAQARLTAAHTKLDHQQHDAAITHALSGLALTNDPECRFALHLVLGDVHHDRADMQAATTAYYEALKEAGQSPTMSATAVVRLARRWSDPGRADTEILRLLQNCRDALNATKDTDADSRQLWLQVSAHIAHKATMALPASGAGTVPPEVTLARTIIGELRQDDPPEVTCDVLTECRWALYDFAPPSELIKISSQLKNVAADPEGSEHFRGEALITTTIDQLRLGHLPAARASIAEHRHRTAQSGHGLMPWLQAALDTLFDLWTGHLDTAQERLFGVQQDLLAKAQNARTGDSLRQTWMGQVYWLRREQGRMSDLAADGISKLVEHREYFPVWLASAALLRSEIGQTNAAVDVIRALFDQTDDLRTLPPHGWSVSVLALIAEAVDSLVRGGYPAAELVELCRRTDMLLHPHGGEVVLAGWPAVLLRPVGQVRAMLALALGDFPSALAHLDSCARQVSGSPTQLGWYRFHRARALHGAGNVSSPQARTLLDQALIAAQDHNLTALRDAIQRYNPSPA